MISTSTTVPLAAELIVGVVGALITAVVIWAARYVVKAAKIVGPVFKEWGEAQTLQTLGASNNRALLAMEAQLGTGNREPSWKPIENYLHEMRHDIANHFAALAIAVETNQRTAALVQAAAGTLARSTEQLMSITERLDADLLTIQQREDRTTAEGGKA
jgi:hypothetical protein